MGIRCANHATISASKLALNSPTSGGHLVCIVRLQTKIHDVYFLYLLLMFPAVTIRCFSAQVFRNEGPWPIRDTAKAIAYFRLNTRKDIFEGAGGLLVT
jgi:hypothetical protein